MTHGTEFERVSVDTAVGKGGMPMGGIEKKNNRSEDEKNQMDAAVSKNFNEMSKQGMAHQNSTQLDIKEASSLEESYQKNIIDTVKGRVFDSQQKAIDLAKRVYQIAEQFYYIKDETPILKIVKSFGFSVFKIFDMPEGLSGRIKVYSKIQTIFDSKKVILVNANDPWEHQRFVIAHELAHYLMHFMSWYNEDEKTDSVLLFSQDYKNNADGGNNRSDLKERCADSFAAELLMPKDKFVISYCELTNDELNPTRDRKITIDGLSQKFKTKESSIERRITEVLSD